MGPFCEIPVASPTPAPTPACCPCPTPEPTLEPPTPESTPQPAPASFAGVYASAQAVAHASAHVSALSTPTILVFEVPFGMSQDLCDDILRKYSDDGEREDIETAFTSSLADAAQISDSNTIEVTNMSCSPAASSQFLGNTRVLQAAETYLNVEYEVTVPASSDAESVADSIRSLTNDTPRMSAFLSSLQTALAANADIDVTFASVRAPVVTVIAPASPAPCRCPPVLPHSQHAENCAGSLHGALCDFTC